MLRPAMTGREFQGAKPPRAVHGMMFGLLGPPGRVCGYRGFMPSTATPRGRTTPDPNVLALARLALPDPDDLTETAVIAVYRTLASPETRLALGNWIY